jgi:acetylornithine deacetylase
MIPGETEDLVVGQLQAIADALAAEDPTFRAEVRATLTRDSFEVPADAAIVQTVLRCGGEVLGRPPVTRGFPFWMDAAFLGKAGVETVVIGGSGAGAHETEEWADIETHVQLADILARTAASYCA